MTNNKGGRPKKCFGLKNKELENCIKENVKNKSILLKLTQNELEKLNKIYEKNGKELGLNKSNFYLKILFNYDFNKILKQKNIYEIIKEINKIGININQITKKINQLNYIDNDIKNDIQEIKKLLEVIYNKIENLN